MSRKSPEMMHGSDYAGQDPTGWTVTEKFDGFFARWTGKQLLTRSGQDYNAPEWFTAGLPAFPLDCEAFAGYGKRETLNNCHRWTDKARWRSVELVVFDMPSNLSIGYAVRHDRLDTRIDGYPSHLFVSVARRWTCSSLADLKKSLQNITARGGEGLMIRHPDAPYQVDIVTTMLKVKPEFVS